VIENIMTQSHFCGLLTNDNKKKTTEYKNEVPQKLSSFQDEDTIFGSGEVEALRYVADRERNAISRERNKN